ncbi:MAG TPA: type III pantothenate kinase [candidate division WOR-3 bacterium]|uniref:Type III pantothenate kinase n=1 Tax=candidate division WOR-3 bacterium TaxID=2052148 RepID=A0A7V0LU87_UNCW3|nr:MAG: hypothetical protein DRQ03_05040 [Candidatus Hydrothermae bacterium]HDL60094.1 type III pantothenate kinase [candidate division WOR-3 bacterium]
MDRMVKALCFDIGNTRIRYGLFGNDELMKKGEGVPDPELLKGVNYIAYTSVSSRNYEKVSRIFEQKRNVLHLSAAAQNILTINYTNPLTLGDDRVANALFLFFKFRNGLIIDAGTFITFDLVRKTTHYPLAIIPGIHLLKEIYKRGDNLKKLTPEIGKIPLPHSTGEAIASGLYSLLRGSFREILSLLSEAPDKIILTGGDAHILKDIISEAQVEEDATLWGIYFWLKNQISDFTL